MHAAVVTAVDRPPRLEPFADPVAGPDEVVLEVTAAALSPLVRAQASGRHYSSGTLPMVAGVDGVGRLPDGRRAYFAFPRAPFGAMAERVVTAASSTTLLPDDVDDVTAAAIANPGMASWAALTRRAHLTRGASVLVIGANGSAGRLAIPIARHLGARRVIAAARDVSSAAALSALGADAFVALGQAPTAQVEAFRQHLAGGIDVVLDFVWGAAAEAFFAAAAGHGTGEAAPRIRFVNIGALGGPTITLPAAALRSSGLEVTGSGLGSLAHADLVAAIGEMFRAIGPAGLGVETQVVPLAEVEAAWTLDARARVVFTV